MAGEETLTYAALDDLTQRLVSELSVTPGIDAQQSPIATVLPQTAAGLTIVSAVLRSGRPLVAIDARMPRERIAQILQESGARHCIAEARSEPDFHAEGVQTILSRELIARAQSNGMKQPDAPTRTSIAALLYTSGTSGKPKGVICTQSMMLNDAKHAGDAFGIGPADRVGLVLPHSYGAGLYVFMFALLNGACTCPFDISASDFGGLRDWVYEQGVTVLPITPSYLRNACASGSFDLRRAQLRLVATAGEALYGKDVIAARAHLPCDCLLMNWAGSTEVGVIAAAVVRECEAASDTAMPVGFPAREKVLQLVRADGAPAGLGEVGELLVRSQCISPGYWRDPVATASRFERIGHQISYRTGDLGRFSETGALTLLGRRDDAVKIRGYLVEPSEIEAALLRQTGVRDAVVVAAGSSRLIAYVVAESKPGTRPSAPELRRALSARLPAFMVPSTFVWMPMLPRTERGKVDRRLLPPAERALRDVVEPTNEWERIAAELWKQTLQLDMVGLDDDFSDLGGDSLSAVQLRQAAFETLRVELSPDVLLRAPTLGQFARALSRSDKVSDSPLVPIRAEGSLPPIFCFAGVGGLALTFSAFARNAPDDQPVYAFHASDIATSVTRTGSIVQAAQRSVAELLRSHPTGPFILMGHSLGGLIALEAAHQLRARGREVALLVLVDTYVFGDELVAGALRGSSRFHVPRTLLQLVGQQLGEPAWRGRFAATVWRLQEHLKQRIFAMHGTYLLRRHKPKRWTEAALVFRAQDNSQPTAMLARLLPSAVHEVVSGTDHFSIMREPHIRQIAASIKAATQPSAAPKH